MRGKLCQRRGDAIIVAKKKNVHYSWSVADAGLHSIVRGHVNVQIGLSTKAIVKSIVLSNSMQKNAEIEL